MWWRRLLLVWDMRMIKTVVAHTKSDRAVLHYQRSLVTALELSGGPDQGPTDSSSPQRGRTVNGELPGDCQHVGGQMALRDQGDFADGLGPWHPGIKRRN